MLKAAKYISILFAAFLFFTTCKKYPEGGYEKQGPKVLLKHVWRLKLYEVNGIDSTNLINYSGDVKYTWVSFFKGNNSEVYGENYPLTYFINFSENNTMLSFENSTYENLTTKCYNTTQTSGCYRLFFSPEGHAITEWKILKLTKKEFILTCSRRNQYKLKFINGWW